MEVEDDPRSRYSDYSCVTPIENLTNDIELLFRKWQARDIMIHHNWKEDHTETFLGGSVRIELFSKPGKNSEEEDHVFHQRWGADRSGSTAAHLIEWFGVSRCAAIFLTRESSLLRGWSSTAQPSPSDKARASTALSALLLAATNCGISDLPLFGVVLADASGASRFGPYDVICGFMHRQGKITNMECDQRNQVMASYRRLNGLVELFDARLKRIHNQYDVSRARVSAKHLWRWEPSMWLRSPAWRRWPYLGEDKHDLKGVRWLQQILGVLPFKSNSLCSKQDPLLKLEVLAHWPTFRCGAKVETTTHSTLRRQDASVQMRAEWATYYDRQPPLAKQCAFLAACLIHAVTLELQSTSAPFTLADLKSKRNLQAAYQSAGKVIGTSEQIASSVSASLKESCELLGAPRAAPPADIEEVVSERVSRILCTELQGKTEKDCLWNYMPHTAPIGRLVSLMAWYAGSLETLAGAGGVGHVWCEMLSQLRGHWEAQLPLVCMERNTDVDKTRPLYMESRRPFHLDNHHPAEPDLNLALLSQKLQVIDLCIRSSVSDMESDVVGVSSSPEALNDKNEDTGVKEGVDLMDSNQDKTIENNDNETGDVELEEDASFLDCEEERTSQHSTEQSTLEEAPQEKSYSPSEEGYASCEDMVTPTLQRLAPVTSDSDRSVQHLLAQLKPGDDSFTKVHDQVRLSALMADVHSFKSANPKAKFSHFLDWYHPSDKTESNNELSEEELEKVWESGGSDKILFNFTAEAEKALHYMETLPASTALEQLILALIPTCLFAISNAVRDVSQRGSLPCLKKAMKKVESNGRAAVDALNESYPLGTVPQAIFICMDKFTSSLAHIELMLDQACSLLYRFPESYELVDALLRGEVLLNEEYKQSVFSFLDREHQKSKSQQVKHSLEKQESGESFGEDHGTAGSEEEGEVVSMSAQEVQEAEREVMKELREEEEESEASQSLIAKPTEREYVLRFSSGQEKKAPSGLEPACTARMGCLVNEADTFPTTRAVRITFRSETADLNST